MHMVAPRTGADEITIAENQLEYKPLVACGYLTAAGVTLLTRWRLNEEDRARVAAGEDVYLAVVTGGKPLQPLHIQVGPAGWEVAP